MFTARCARSADRFHQVLTDSGFAPCGRVCLDGQSYGDETRPSADGTHAVYVESTGTRNAAGARGVRLTSIDLVTGQARAILDGVTPPEGFDVDRIEDCAISSDGSTVMHEVLEPGATPEDAPTEQAWVVSVR